MRLADAALISPSLEVTFTVFPVRLAPSALMAFVALSVTASPLLSVADFARREAPASTVKTSFVLNFTSERFTSLPALTVRLLRLSALALSLLERSTLPFFVVTERATLSFSRSVTSLRLAFSEALTLNAVEEIVARSSATESSLEVALTVAPVRLAPSALMAFAALSVTASPLLSVAAVARRVPCAFTVKASFAFIFA